MMERRQIVRAVWKRSMLSVHYVDTEELEFLLVQLLEECAKQKSDPSDRIG